MSGGKSHNLRAALSLFASQDWPASLSRPSGDKKKKKSLSLTRGSADGWAPRDLSRDAVLWKRPASYGLRVEVPLPPGPKACCFPKACAKCIWRQHPQRPLRAPERSTHTPSQVRPLPEHPSLDQYHPSGIIQIRASVQSRLPTPPPPHPKRLERQILKLFAQRELLKRSQINMHVKLISCIS